jgi:hypothetical protein
MNSLESEAEARSVHVVLSMVEVVPAAYKGSGGE